MSVIEATYKRIPSIKTDKEFTKIKKAIYKRLRDDDILEKINLQKDDVFYECTLKEIYSFHGDIIPDERGRKVIVSEEKVIVSEQLKTIWKLRNEFGCHDDYSVTRDGIIDYEGTIRLDGWNLKKIPLKFRSVSDGFIFGSNELTSLKGSPPVECGCFRCNDNKLTSLEFCPKIVNGDFDCSSNKITSLEFGPEKVEEDYNFSDNMVWDFKDFLLIIISIKTK